MEVDQNDDNLPRINIVRRRNRRGRAARPQLNIRQANAHIAIARIQKYRYIWQLEPDYRRWLRRQRNDPTKARCKICPGNRSFNAHLNTIKGHANSRRHREIIRELPPDNNQYPTIEDHEREIARIISMLCLFFAKKNLPLNLIDELLPLIVNLSTNINALYDVKIETTTFTKIMKNVLAKFYETELKEILRRKKFTILIDETTDVSVEKSWMRSSQIFQ